jgi:hypothetical protein
VGKKYTFPLASGFVQKDVWVSITSIHQKVQMINGQDGGMTEMAGKNKIIYVGPMKWELSVNKLDKEDYQLPERLKVWVCRICGLLPKQCIICNEAFDVEQLVACGIGHVCYSCWDELPENPQPKGDGE